MKGKKVNFLELVLLLAIAAMFLVMLYFMRF